MNNSLTNKSVDKFSVAINIFFIILAKQVTKYSESIYYYC